MKNGSVIANGDLAVSGQFVVRKKMAVSENESSRVISAIANRCAKKMVVSGGITAFFLNREAATLAKMVVSGRLKIAKGQS